MLPNRLFWVFISLILLQTGFLWGFFAHQHINRLAVFALPPEMIGFYKANIQYLTESAINPDRRRYAIPEEAPRHYIDLEDYGDSALYNLPRYYPESLEKYGEVFLHEHGILPWHINTMYYRLKESFLLKDPQRILRISSELGHYLGDAHVPLHSTRNYNGQLTGQDGIHGFWESRLPELYFPEYDFFVGRAEYIENVQLMAWDIIAASHAAVDSVLEIEKRLNDKLDDSKFSFETRGSQTVKVIAERYSRDYHDMLSGMVERRMRASVKAIADVWFTAWVDAGQPDLQSLINYEPSEEELAQRAEEIQIWKAGEFESRQHERE